MTFFVDQSYFRENRLKDGNSSNWAVHYGPSMSALSLPSYCKIGHGMFEEILVFQADRKLVDCLIHSSIVVYKGIIPIVCIK